MQKPWNLSVHKSEECGHGKGVGVYVTLLQSDTVQPYGHVKANCGGLTTQKDKGPECNSSEREECCHGEGVSTEDVRESALCTYDVVYSRKTTRHL